MALSLSCMCCRSPKCPKSTCKGARNAFYFAPRKPSSCLSSSTLAFPSFPISKACLPCVPGLNYPSPLPLARLAKVLHYSKHMTFTTINIFVWLPLYSKHACQGEGRSEEKPPFSPLVFMHSQSFMNFYWLS